MKFESKYFGDIISYNGSLSLLDTFINDKLSFYKSKRNFDFGSYKKNYVSALSPALSRRILTEKKIIARVSNQFSYGQVEKYVDEICWRTYWKGWLEHRPKVWHDYLSDLSILDDKKNNKNYSNAVIGQTGLECFDDWVKDLLEFGYLHNHSRMWFASIWIFYFRLPWQLGAEFFYQNLIDADPASNTLSWKWVAGLQTKGKKYITYQENIDRFTGSRYEFPEQFKLQDNLVDEYIFYEPKYKIRNSTASSNIKKGYIVIEDDLSFDNIEKNYPVLIQSESYNPFNQSNHVKSFSNDALKQAIEHCKNNISGKVTTFNWQNPSVIKKWILDNSIDELEIIAPTVGKYDTLIPSTLNNLDAKISYYYHDWDLLFWQHADKGFFKLKKNIKNIISPFWSNPLFGAS